MESHPHSHNSTTTKNHLMINNSDWLLGVNYMIWENSGYYRLFLMWWLSLKTLNMTDICVDVLDSSCWFQLQTQKNWLESKEKGNY